MTTLTPFRTTFLLLGAMVLTGGTSCSHAPETQIEALRQAAVTDSFMPAPEEFTPLQTPAAAYPGYAAVTAALADGEPGAWVARAWDAWPELLMPALHWHRYIYAADPAMDGALTSLAPYLFVWPAATADGTVPASLAPSAALTGLSAVPWEEAVSSAIRIAIEFGEDGQMRWTGPFQDWAEGENPNPADFSADVIWYEQGEPESTRPYFQEYGDEVLDGAPVTELVTSSILEELGGTGDFMDWAVLHEYRERCAASPHARPAAAGTALLSLFEHAVSNLARLPASMEEACWATATKLVNLVPVTEPGAAVLECWRDETQTIRVRIVFEMDIVEDTCLFWTSLNAESGEHLMVPTELLVEYGFVPEEWQLLGRWALADTGNLWVPQPPAE